MNRLRTVDWYRVLLALYAVSVLAVALPKTLDPHAHADNFAIFRQSWGNLLGGRNLYVLHPGVPDLFKYSPSFAVLFAPVWMLPPVVGLVVWDALNSLLLCWALSRLLSRRAAAIALALIYFEVLGAMQHSQSNGLVTALVVLAYVTLEERHERSAAAAIAAGTIVKIFPLAAVALGVLYRRRVRFAVWFALSMAVLLALPLLVVSPRELLWQYHNWAAQQAVDTQTVLRPTDRVLSGGVMGLLRLWFGVTWPNWTVELAGTVLLLLPLARWGAWAEEGFRIRFLASLLIYMVIFNHRAEAPTFVVAITGVALWYVTTPRDRVHDATMILTVLLVSIISNDITPRPVRDWLVQFHLKAVPCIIAFAVIQLELWGVREGQLAAGGVRRAAGDVVAGEWDDGTMGRGTGDAFPVPSSRRPFPQ